MTLDEWAKRHNVRILRSESFPTMRIVVDFDIPDEARRSLYNLSDYSVSGISGGAVWLRPKESM